MHEHIGSTGKHAVDDVHGGSHKEEGELQGLSDTGDHGGQSGGEQQAAHHLAVFRPGAAVHGQSSARQAENHQGELTAHEAGSGHGEVLNAGGGQLGKEDVLSALHQVSGHGGGAAHSGLPEGDVEHVVQAEGDEGTLDEAVQPGTGVAAGQHKAAQVIDAGLDGGPDVVHGDAHHQVGGGGDDGDEPGATEEGEHLGQLNLIEPIVQGCHTQAHHDAAEHAHLQGVQAHHGGGGAGQVGGAEGVDHGPYGGVHHEEGDGCRQGRHFLLLLGHTDGHAHGEDQRQVVKDHRTGGVEHLQNGIDEGAGAHDAHEAVGLQHGGVGKGPADAQKQARHGQDGDGQHKGAAHPLQYAEYFVFHQKFSSFACPMARAKRCK